MSRMAEAEVSLRLGEWLLRNDFVDGVVEIAIDDAVAWQGMYRTGPGPNRVRIHSSPGKGDVVTHMRSGRVVRAECKKGPLVRSKSSQEYSLLREALGQLLTMDEVRDDDLLVVAVPHREKFAELADRWREAHLHMLCATITSRLGLSIFGQAKSAEIPFSEVRRKAERLWPLWA